MNAEARTSEPNWLEVIEAAESRFVEIAPQGMEFIAERAFAVQLLNNNDYLKRSAMGHPASLQAAILNVAAIGLSLNPAKKQAYLIPRTVKHKDANTGKWNYVTKIFLEPSYMGLCDLATMSGSVKWVQADIVRAKDKFVKNAPGVLPVHEFSAFATEEDRGPIVGAYCVAKTEGGDYLTTTMSLAEIHDIRNRSEAWKQKMEKEAKGEKGFGGPWETDEPEQMKKTVIRRAYKTWPKTPTTERIAMAVNLSNENEGFDSIQTSPELRQFTGRQKEYFDHMIEKADALGMFVFQHTIEETVFNNLFHSFERGKKGKYQQVIRDLLQKGGAMLRDIVDTVNEQAASGNDYSVRENIEGLSKEALGLILDQCSAEAAAMIREINKESA